MSGGPRLFTQDMLYREHRPKHLEAIRRAKEERARAEEIRAKYEASKSPRPADSLASGSGAVDGQEPACAAPAPALPSLRCKLCDVRASYPRLCRGCSEVR